MVVVIVFVDADDVIFQDTRKWKSLDGMVHVRLHVGPDAATTQVLEISRTLELLPVLRGVDTVSSTA